MKWIDSLRWFFLGASLEAQRARRVGKILLLLALFIALFWVVPFQGVFKNLLMANPGLFAAGVCLSLVSISFGALELEPLTRNQGMGQNFWQLLSINLAVKFYLLFTPSSLIASGIRWYRLSKPNGRVAESLVALAFYRLLEVFLTIAFGLGFWFLSGQESVKIGFQWLVVLILGVMFFWYMATRWSKPIYFRVKSQTSHIWQKPYLLALLQKFEKLILAVAAYAEMPGRDIFLSISAGVAAQLIGLASSLCVARAIGIELSYIELGWIIALVNLAIQLPFAIVGGLGIREVTLVAVLPIYGIGAELALAYSLLLFARQVLVSLVGGVLEIIGVVSEKRVA